MRRRYNHEARTVLLPFARTISIALFQPFPCDMARGDVTMGRSPLCSPQTPWHRKQFFNANQTCNYDASHRMNRRAFLFSSNASIRQFHSRVGGERETSARATGVIVGGIAMRFVEVEILARIDNNRLDGFKCNPHSHTQRGTFRHINTSGAHIKHTPTWLLT